jgi:hypothetical protein
MEVDLSLIKTKVKASIGLGINDVNQIIEVLKEDKEILQANLDKYITIEVVQKFMDEIIEDTKAVYSKAYKNIYFELNRLDQLYKNAILGGDIKTATEIQKMRLKLMQDANLLPSPNN